MNNMLNNTSQPHPSIVFFKLKNLLSMAITVTLLGCTVTPTYKAPTPPAIDQYTQTPLATDDEKQSISAMQTLVSRESLPAQWWTLFQSPELNYWIVSALDTNFELKAAEAAIRQAQELYYAQGASSLPTVDLNTSITREKFSGASVGFPEIPPTLYTLYNASVDVSYNLDLFGKEEHIQLLSKNQLDQARLQSNAIYLTLVANVVNQFIHIAALDDELTERKTLLTLEQQRSDLLQQDMTLGAATPAELLTQADRVYQASSAVLLTQKQRDFSRHQFAVLLGKAPTQLQLETLTLGNLTLPAELPVSLPSALVKQRPDIQLAELLIQARHSELGIAITNQLPQLTLSGSYGSLSTDASTFFDPESMVWNAVAGVTQPLFNGGQLKHKKEATKEALLQANSLYQQTVLEAFKQVADSLLAIHYGGQINTQAKGVEQNTKNLLALAQQEQSLGSMSLLQILDTRVQYHQARIERIQIQSTQFSDTVALFQSLGGGWWQEDKEI